MNVLQFGGGACQKVRRYLDSYVSNELLVETNHEVLRHLERCPGCSAELEARLRLRGMVQKAVRQQSAPPHLEARIRQAIREEGSRANAPAMWSRWVLAAAATVMIAFGGWFALQWRRPPRLEDYPTRAQQDAYIQKISTRLAGIFGVGLGDHVHCSVFRRFRKELPTFEKMLQEMGEEWVGLVTIAKQRAPAEYQILLAHKCDYKGRNFVHLTLKNGGSLVSLVISKKDEGESFSDAAPAMNESGVAIHQAGVQPFQVAGFESRDYLAFIVSDLSSEKNLQMTASLAPAVRDFLARRES